MSVTEVDEPGWLSSKLKRVHREDSPCRQTRSCLRPARSRVVLEIGEGEARKAWGQHEGPSILWEASHSLLDFDSSP